VPRGEVMWQVRADVVAPEQDSWQRRVAIACWRVSGKLGHVGTRGVCRWSLIGAWRSVRPPMATVPPPNGRSASEESKSVVSFLNLSSESLRSRLQKMQR
jgi:hypothetical protein